MHNDNIPYSYFEIIDIIKDSIGKGFEPLFDLPVFHEVCKAFMDFTYWQRFSLDQNETRQNYLEALEAWNHVKSNFQPIEIKKNLLNEKLMELYDKEKIMRDFQI